jgi:CSLREA domain-containing protein
MGIAGTITIGNAVVLQSDSLINISTSTIGGSRTLTFAQTVSGPGRLTLDPPGTNSNAGTLSLEAANTYSGGTTINGGQLLLNKPAASLGSGDVIVVSGSLKIDSAVANAIEDKAAVSLAGGGTAGAADLGYIELGPGVNETVGVLKLNGVPQVAGTYGSSSSSATHKNDEFFAGSGILTVASLTVTTPADHDDGTCGVLDCSLRERSMRPTACPAQTSSSSRTNLRASSKSRARCPRSRLISRLSDRAPT